VRPVTGHGEDGLSNFNSKSGQAHETQLQTPAKLEIIANALEPLFALYNTSLRELKELRPALDPRKETRAKSFC
jgi:hypothetical protein